MTADEGRRPSPDDEPPANDSPSRSPSADPSPDDTDTEESADPSSERTGVGTRPGTETETETETRPEPAPGKNTGGRTDGDAPAPGTRTNGGREARAPDPVPSAADEDESLLARIRHAKSGPLFFLREIGTSAGAVVLVGLLLFGVSGVWPPMVAVESGSMEPHMHKGDLVFITEPGRYTPDAAYGSTGVVTAETGADVGYRTFGGDGSVVVYDDPGRGGPPIIHRAEFYVEAGENWYDRTDPEFVSADNCRELRNCPAPHAGFITKGDANSQYDQASGIAEPVRPSWITGIARVRIPYLGWVRLGLADVAQGRAASLGGGETGPWVAVLSTVSEPTPPSTVAVTVETGSHAGAVAVSDAPTIGRAVEGEPVVSAGVGPGNATAGTVATA